MKKWLFNPFIHVAGWQALGFGFLWMLLTAIVAFFSKTHFDGVIDVHFGARFSFGICVTEQLNAWLSTVISFFAIGFSLSKSKIRWIDVAGTLALARAPMFFAAIIGFVPVLHQFPSAHNLAGIAIWSLIVVIFTIWMIALMYNAFVVSCNIRSSKAIWGFIISIILAEILSKVIIAQVYQHFLSK